MPPVLRICAASLSVRQPPAASGGGKYSWAPRAGDRKKRQSESFMWVATQSVYAGALRGAQENRRQPLAPARRRLRPKVQLHRPLRAKRRRRDAELSAEEDG